MRGQGIPPSIDRQERIIGLTVGGVILLAVFLGVLYALLRASYQGPEFGAAPGQDSAARLEAYLAEKERASAYAVVRDTLDQRSQDPGIRAVYCRDSRHRWVEGRIEFRGEVDFEGADGDLYHNVYIVVLSGSDKNGWKVISTQVRPADVTGNL